MIEVCGASNQSTHSRAKRRLALKKNSKMTRSRKNATRPSTTTLLTRTVGIDLGDRMSHYCILDEQGEVVAEGTLRTTEAGFREQFQRTAPATVAMEKGAHSPWA